MTVHPTPTSGFATALLPLLPLALGLSPPSPKDNVPAAAPETFVILGGSGRIGTAVASHLLSRLPPPSRCRVVLVGRCECEERGSAAVSEVLSEHGGVEGETDTGGVDVSFRHADWRNDDELRGAVEGCTCLIHAAGPFLGERPTPLRAAIDAGGCRAYVDVSDPLDYLEESMKMNDDAEGTGLSALLAAGAFPGMSNVMAIEAASSLSAEDDGAIQDTRFNYFTAGLGGSGDVNLYITNLGFGEPMVQYERGKLRSYEALSGSLLGKVSFFLSEEESSKTQQSTTLAFGNDDARRRVGRQTVFA